MSTVVNGYEAPSMYTPSSYRKTAGSPRSSSAEWSGDGSNSATRGLLTTCAPRLAAEMIERDAEQNVRLSAGRRCRMMS
jgi:hypothetical protein